VLETGAATSAVGASPPSASGAFAFFVFAAGFFSSESAMIKNL
jgi:hypothetical protein